MRLTFAVLLLPSMLLASPQPTARSIAALIVPQDRNAESSGLQFATYIDDALEGFAGFQVRRSEELFGLPVDDEVQSAYARAEKGFQDSKDAFEHRRYEDAERKLRTTLKEYERSVVLLHACGHYCDALAMYSASLFARGDSEEAKLMLLDVLCLSPAYELSTKVFSRDFIQFRASTSTSLSAAMRGSLVVRSHPNGARVFVDGDLRGYTPLTVGPLTMGKHLLRLEHPGYRQRGEIVEVTPEEQEFKADLVPTPLYKRYAAGMPSIALEVAKAQIGPATASAARTLLLDRVMVGVVKDLTNSNATEMSIGLFDVRSGRRLAEKKVIFQGDEYGQLKAEVARVVTGVINSAEIGGDHRSMSGDPLGARHGTEEWGGEDRGGRNIQAERHSSGDPLQGVNGTEQW